MGRVSRSIDGWNDRVALAEALNAKVISDLKIGCGFPTDHPLHAGAPASNAMVPEAIAAIKAADVILALDWVDLAGALRNALGHEAPNRVIAMQLIAAHGGNHANPLRAQIEGEKMKEVT